MLAEESKYKLITLPPFQIKLEIDLSRVVTSGKTQKNLLRQLQNASDTKNNDRRLSSGEGWAANYDIEIDIDDSEATAPQPPKTNSVGEWILNNDSNNEIITSQNNYESVGTQPSTTTVHPLSSLGTIKDALQQRNAGIDKKDFSTHIGNLLMEYTTDFITFFCYEALQSNERVQRGWDVVHAIDLRANLSGMTFYNEETHFIEDSDNHDQEESFVSLTFGFSGTAAILKGENVHNIIKGNTISDGPSGIRNLPTIDSNELRLMLRAAYAPPDGPYKYLTYVLDESDNDREEFILDEMTFEDSIEHAVTVLLGGSRDVAVRTDLDYPSGLQASSSTFVRVGSETAERRESIAVFFEGLFFVVFIGGFYIYASYKFRRNHLKQELMKYGEGAILVKSGEQTLFSSDSKFKSRFRFMTKWLKHNRVKNAPSPTSMETLEEDGYFGSESFDSDDYNDHDLEVGLKESYDESNRDKSGLDMAPIDVNSFSPSGGVITMKAVDDDHKNFLQSMVDNGVVPIPAKDDENAAYLMSKKGKRKSKKALPDGAGSVIVQRRYVQPAAPLEVLYGASFLHGEAERVEALRRLRKKKKIRASPSGRNRVKKKKKATAKLVEQAMSGHRSKHTVNPMMTITESIDEVVGDDYEIDEEDDFAVPFSAYSPSNFMRNLSEWALGEKLSIENDEYGDEGEDESEDGEGAGGEIQLSANANANAVDSEEVIESEEEGSKTDTNKDFISNDNAPNDVIPQNNKDVYEMEEEKVEGDEEAVAEEEVKAAIKGDTDSNLLDVNSVSEDNV